MAILPILLTNLILLTSAPIAQSAWLSKDQAEPLTSHTGEKLKETGQAVKKDTSEAINRTRDRIATTTSNLAQKARDKANEAQKASKITAIKHLDLNTNRPGILQSAFGISRAEAKAIIKYRNTLKDKRFQSAEELRKIKELQKMSAERLANLIKIAKGIATLD